ncbi:hypothetical protein [uncultured Maricaulis sp.]|uniref:hypothetical protein n=1 Tax=uncultured Maricaulis sp. TaxID=174710 RepID=UPI0030D6DC23|tara:strand:- start:38781 stop:39323 length:543 start_codon:yes stop_codon:yes gene_type:complete
MTRSQLTRLGLILVPLGVASFLLHEAGHYFAGRAFGLNMFLQLNSAGPVDGTLELSWLARFSILAGGPAVTIVEGVLGFLIVRRMPVIGVSLAYFAFYMRMLSFGMSVFIHPNDEAKMGVMTGIGIYPIHLAVCAVLAILAVLAIRRAGGGWGTWLVCFVASSLAVTLAVFGDPLIGRIL